MGMEKQIGIRIGNDLKEDLGRLAALDHRTLSDYCRLVLEERVKAERAKKTEKE
jgi:predicted DNA-binding protein